MHESVNASLAVYLVHTLCNRIAVCTAFMSENSVNGRYKMVKNCKVVIIVEHSYHFLYWQWIMHLVRKDSIVVICLDFAKPEIIDKVWQKVWHICLEFVDGFF